MKNTLLALSFVAAAAASASAQDLAWTGAVPVEKTESLDPAYDPLAQAPPHRMYLAGIRAGFVDGSDAEDPGFSFGAYARFFGVPRLALDLGLDWHEMDYLDGDATVTQIPIMIGIVLEPMEGEQLAPYVVAGLGMVWTEVDFTGPLSSVSSDDDTLFGAYGGAGLQWTPRKGFGVTFEVRYVAVSEGSFGPSGWDEDLDYVQVTFGFHAEY